MAMLKREQKQYDLAGRQREGGQQSWVFINGFINGQTEDPPSRLPARRRSDLSIRMSARRPELQKAFSPRLLPCSVKPSSPLQASAAGS